MGEMTHGRIDAEAEEQLCGEDHPMPFMEPEIEGVDLTEGKKEHEEDQPRKDGLERQEVCVTQGTDYHREPEGVTIKQTFDIGYWRLEI